MPVGLLGKKVGITQVYDEEGRVVPVTVIEAGPCTVLQVKNLDRDGYEGVQIEFEDKLNAKDLQREEGQRKRNRANRAERGHVAQLKSKRQQRLAEAGVEASPKAGCEPKRMICEFRTDGEDAGYEVGQESTAELLAEVKHVGVIGISKGRGTAGVMKRHNFKGQRASHGVKKVLQGVGQATDPEKFGKRSRSIEMKNETMVSAPIRDLAGGDSGTYEFDENDLADRISKQLLHDVVVMYDANRRQGTIRTKTRSEVAGRKKKMFRQKRTGNARRMTFAMLFWNCGMFASWLSVRKTSPKSFGSGSYTRLEKSSGAVA